MEKMGIENLKALTVAVSSLGASLEGIFADGKVDWKDLTSLGALFAPLMQLSDADLKQVLPEVKDIDNLEMLELNEVFRDNFDLENDAIEVVVEKGLEYVLKGIEAIQFFMSLAKKSDDS